MAYRAPLYSYHHALRDRGYGNVTHYGTLADGYPIYNLYDNRNTTTCAFGTVYTDPWVQVDLGGTFDTGYNRLIIPANHNIATVKVEQADDAAFTTNVETLHATDTGPTAGYAYDSGTFDTQASDRRYIRVTFIGTSVYYMTQLVLTKMVSLSVGPDLASSTDRYVANTRQIVQPSGNVLSVQHGPHQRVLEYTYNYALTGTDLTALEGLITYVGLERPFFVSPASFSATPDVDDPPLMVRFSEMPQQKLSVAVPMNGSRAKIISLSMIEAVD